MISYRIKDWESVFEVSDSRKVDGPLKWVAIRTATDGLGFGRIAAEKNACELLAAWHLIVAVAAKQKREDRGKLMRDGQPLTPDDFELMTRFPAQVFERAIAYFSSPRMGWLIPEGESEPVRTAPDASVPAPATGQDRTVEDRTVQDKKAASPELPFSSPRFSDSWNLFRKHRKEIKKPLTATSEAATLKWCADLGEQRAIAAIEHTIRKGWQGLREPDAPAGPTTRQPGTNQHQMPASRHFPGCWETVCIKENERRAAAGLPPMTDTEAKELLTANNITA